MTDINISDIKNELVLYFDTKEKCVNAYTLASALVALADSAKEANKIINPGFEVEIIVTALEEGSFKAVVKTVFKDLKNLFSSESVRTIILSIIAAMIYDKYFSQKQNININITPEYVIVSSDTEKIIMPKEIYDAKELVKKSEKVSTKVDSIMLSVKNDSRVTGIGVSSQNMKRPAIVIKKGEIEKAYKESTLGEENFREISELTKIEVLRAILEESDRLWEFVWHGTKIAAPVIDKEFYKKFRDHRITLAPGDKFDVRLKIIQKKDENSGIYINSKYEIVEVIKHIPRITERQLSN